MEYSKNMNDAYENVDEYDPKKNQTIVIISDVKAQKNTIRDSRFIWDRELNMSIVLIIQSHFRVLEDIRINSARDIIMNSPNTREVQQIAYKHVSDIDSDEFIKSYKNTNQKSHWFVIHSNIF